MFETCPLFGEMSQYSDLRYVEKSQQISTVPLAFTHDYAVIIRSDPAFSRDHAIFFIVLGINKEWADLNHRPLDLQSNALPLSYTLDFFLHELSNNQIIYIYYCSC